MGSTERGARYAQVNRSLAYEFTAALAGLDWSVALLQEAPPRWLEPLGGGCRASGASALTSRNGLPALRAALARRNPDLIASNEGGSNQVLVRWPWRVADVRREVLTRRPERRVLLLVRAREPGGAELCVGCLHASRGPKAAAADLARAAVLATDWAGPRPLLLGGDFNVRPAEDPESYASLERRHGLRPALGDSVDQLVARGVDVVAAPAVLPAAHREVDDGSGLLLRLSDHSQVAASFGMR